MVGYMHLYGLLREMMHLHGLCKLYKEMVNLTLETCVRDS